MAPVPVGRSTRCHLPRWGRWQRRLLAIGLNGVIGSSALAGSLENCRQRRLQRDDLASRSMQAEIVLLQELRDRICPVLRRQADAANAANPQANRTGESIDYQALLLCRRRAEQLLERTRPVLYRNRLGFLYYTPSGAALARQADAVALTMATAEANCP